MLFNSFTFVIFFTLVCIAMAVSFLFTGKIRKLDMVGTLKGAE